MVEYSWILNIFCALVRIKIQRMLQCTTNQILMSNLELLQPWFWWQNRNLDYRKLVQTFPKCIFLLKIFSKKLIFTNHISNLIPPQKHWRKFALFMISLFSIYEDFKFLQHGTLFSMWNCEITSRQIRWAFYIHKQVFKNINCKKGIENVFNSRMLTNSYINLFQNINCKIGFHNS